MILQNIIHDIVYGLNSNKMSVDQASEYLQNEVKSYIKEVIEEFKLYTNGYEELKEQYRVLENGNKQVLKEMHWLVDRNTNLRELLECAVEEIENCYSRDTDLTIKIRTLLNTD